MTTCRSVVIKAGVVVLAGTIVVGGSGTAFAVASSSAAVVIDAAKDPQGAAQAMALFQAPGTTGQSFDLTDNPVYGHSSPAVESDGFEVPGGQPAAQTTLTATHTTTSSWSVGGSLETKVALGCIGFADSALSVKVTASHEWTTGQTESQAVTVTVDPGNEAWIDGYTGQVTFTGNYHFTANGTNYEIDNVTITQPGNPGGNWLTNSTYMVVTHKLSSSDAPTYAQAGVVPQRELPQP